MLWLGLDLCCPGNGRVLGGGLGGNIVQAVIYWGGFVNMSSFLTS